MITEWPYIYVYATGDRSDGMAYAVGMMAEDGPADGCVALFATADMAELFANVLAGHNGGTVSIMPSVRRTI